MLIFLFTPPAYLSLIFLAALCGIIYIVRTPLKSSKRPYFISVAGSIAVGKTTFCGKLGSILNLQVYEESVSDNPYLDKFYKDQKSWAFHLQIYFLGHRFEQQKRISSNLGEAQIGAIQDRTIYEDVVFARVLKNDNIMTEVDFKTYSSTLKNMMECILVPDIIIFLRASAETCLKRVKKR